MTDTPLCALAEKYGTDKKSRHNYTPTYYALFKDRTDTVQRVLEIGIKRGASLYMWQEFFPNAQIFGLDHKPKRLINAGRIKSFLGSQLDATSLGQAAVNAGGRFDLIVDDGSHKPEHQVFSARVLLPYLAADGVYVIEDVKEQKIADKIPARDYQWEINRTGTLINSVLIIIRRAAR